uniref:Uncharacterized protein n=1 Tax=Oryza brachyantha TaxID=4533 RepID=J3KZQ2_ORYBR
MVTVAGAYRRRERRGGVRVRAARLLRRGGGGEVAGSTYGVLERGKSLDASLPIRFSSEGADNLIVNDCLNRQVHRVSAQESTVCLMDTVS